MYFKWLTCLQERIGKNTVNILKNFDINEEKSESMIIMGQSKGFRRKENQKLNKSDREVISVSNYDASLSLLKSQGDVEVQASLRMDEDTNNCIEYIDDPECSFQKELR
jgi:hypothetical protein